MLEKNMEAGMQNYRVNGSEGVTHTWDIIQTEVCKWEWFFWIDQFLGAKDSEVNEGQDVST